MLCKLSGPRHGEKTADPFCGYGSIPEARLRHFPPGEFFASDIDPKALAYSKSKFKGNHLCHFECIDARELQRIIPPASLDSIVTDPPWGLYKEAGNGEAWYLKVFADLLKPGGRVVLLCGRGNMEEPLEKAAVENSFTINRRVPVLVSGRKAVIFLLTKA
jgi:tRNA G10  N-methylase Trm11